MDIQEGKLTMVILDSGPFFDFYIYFDSVPEYSGGQQQWGGYYEQPSVPVVTAPAPVVNVSALNPVPPAISLQPEHTSPTTAPQVQSRSVSPNAPSHTLSPQTQLPQHHGSTSTKKKATKTLLIYNNNDFSPVS